MTKPDAEQTREERAQAILQKIRAGEVSVSMSGIEYYFETDAYFACCRDAIRDGLFSGERRLAASADAAALLRGETLSDGTTLAPEGIPVE